MLVVTVTLSDALRLGILRRRCALGLSQQDLATAAGLSRPAISLIEAGLRPSPRAESLARIAAALGCTELELLDAGREAP